MFFEKDFIHEVSQPGISFKNRCFFCHSGYLPLPLQPILKGSKSSKSLIGLRLWKDCKLLEPVELLKRLINKLW